MPETPPVTMAPPAEPSAWWSRPAAWLRRPGHADLIGCLVLLLVSGIVIAKALHWDAWIARTDLLTTYGPLYALTGEQLRHFNLPGWSPYQASGLPLAGDPQSGWMYLLVMLFYTLLPPIYALKAMLAFQILLAAFSAYLFARMLGMRVVASLVGAVAFALGANVYHNTYCCTIWSQGSTWLPLGFIGIELGIRPGPTRYRAGGWAIAGFAISQIFAGWLGQGVYNALLMLGAYLAYRTLIHPPEGLAPFRERVRAMLIAGAAMLVLGIGLASAGLLPRLDANRHSQLAGGYEDVAEADGRDSGWVPKYMLFQVLDTTTESRGTPFIQESNRRLYIGGITASLALVAVFVARRRFATPFFTVVAAIMLILVTKETALHRLFYLLPRYQSLHEHTPFRLLGLFFIAPAMLAAATVESINRWARQRLLFLAALVPIIVMVAVSEYVDSPRRHIGSQVVESATFVTIALLAAAAIGFHERWGGNHIRSDHLYQGLRIVLLLALLWEPTGRQLIEDGTTSVRMETPLRATVDRALADTDPGGAGEFLQQQLALSDQPFRYYGYDGAELRTEEDEGGSTYQGRVTYPQIQSLLVSGRAMRLGLYDVQGYNPAQSALYADFIRAVNQDVAQNYHDVNVLRSGLGSPLLDLINVRYIVVPRDVPPGRPDLLRLSQLYPTVFVNDQVRVLENSAALPRAWMVHDTQVASPEETLALLGSGAIDPRHVALVSEAIPNLAPAPPGSGDQVRFTTFAPNQIVLATDTSATGLLIVNEIDAPGWVAYVDGERTPVHRVNYLQRGVVVPAGAHTVRLRYEPLSLRAGLAISSLTLFIMLGIGAIILLSWTSFGRRWASQMRQPKRATVRRLLRPSG